MKVYFNLLDNSTIVYFKQNFLRPLSNRTKKIFGVALLAFACLAAYYIYIQIFPPTILNGRGRKIVEDGVEIGVFKDGWLSGEGEIKYKDGRIAKGMFYRSYLDGQGKMTYPDGSEEEGTFSDHKLVKGTRTNPDGKIEEVRPPVQPEKV